MNCHFLWLTAYYSLKLICMFLVTSTCQHFLYSPMFFHPRFKIHGTWPFTLQFHWIKVLSISRAWKKSVITPKIMSQVAFQWLGDFPWYSSQIMYQNLIQACDMLENVKTHLGASMILNQPIFLIFTLGYSWHSLAQKEYRCISQE